MNHLRFYSLNEYYRELFGEKIYKISLQGNFTCPNRDGTVGSRGCIFCSEGGSGEFAADRHLSISQQITDAIDLLKNKKTGNHFIAYFQSFTNTYGPVSYLREIFYEAIQNEKIVGLAIATRPDCLPPEVLSLLEELNTIKPVFVELGLQTMHEDTATFIRRGYPLPVFEKAVFQCKKTGCKVIVHTILGLPGETTDDMLETVSYLNALPIDGIKFSMLHVLKGTDLAKLYANGDFEVFSLPDYIDVLLQCINALRPDIVIHRLTGDGPKDLLIAPLWSTKKRVVLNEIQHQMKQKNCVQGSNYPLHKRKGENM